MLSGSILLSFGNKRYPAIPQKGEYFVLGGSSERGYGNKV